MTDNIPDEKALLASYEALEELRKLQDEIINMDWTHVEKDGQDSESILFQRFGVMLDTYQEQAYLLDPYLESLVGPVVDRIKEFAKASLANPDLVYNAWRVHLISSVLYSYVKFRGYKTIIRFFPHEIADLTIALDFMNLEGGLPKHPHLWSMRYVTLLWLYIICIIPFDLAQFDEPDDVGGTARALQDVAKRHLGASGLEREAAALLLSRLYMRKDTGLGFHEFVESSYTFIQESTSVFEAIGRLSVLCEVVKSGSVEQVEREQAQLLAIANAIPQSKQLSNNIVVRKLRTKLISRIGLRLLPTGSTGKGNLRRARGLIASETETNEIIEDDIDVPTEVEDILQSLFENLQDKDTIVRWSAAKGVARVAERLPKDFCGQVLETVLGLFEVHWIAGASLYDLSAVAEGTWHGACLACAEMARRSLVEPEYLPQLIEWMSKALYFDLRKGAHSIGSNVRDAAAYVLWALARTQNQEALVPHATYLAQRLIAVALFDREIHIRRAASAAFQEHVGRNSLFPHGIDVLAKTDFYSVSIRKNAFLVAAPSVAVHPEYRNFLLDHVLDVVLRHWDIAMRELGAESLRLICAIDLDDLAPRAIKKIVPLMESVDLADVHGGLQALTEIAIAYKQGVDNVEEREKNLQNVFSHLKYVPEKTLTTTRNELVASAACRLIANSITLTEINLGERSSVPNWRKIIDIGLKHRMTTVQEAAADAMAAAISGACTLIKELRRGSPVMQQSLAMVLGVINYNNHPKAVAKALDYLLDCLKPKTTANIETRRSCLQAIPRIILTVSSDLPSYISPEMMNTLTDTLLTGLEDYTIDERGDVGSWARIACIQGLTTICELLFRISGTIPDFGSYLPPHKYRAVAAGLLKQGAERLDNVRQTAGTSILTLLKAPLPAVEADAAGRWRMPAAALLEELFLSEADQSEWNDGTWLFPRVMRLLEVPEYRQPVLSGIVISIGSKTDSTRKPVASSMVSYAQALPLTDNTGNTYSLVALVGDLINHAKSNMTTNAVVVPVIQTFTLLLEADALRQLTADPVGLKHLDALLAMCSRNVSKLKSTQRIHESMKVVTNLLTFEETRTKSIDLLPEFLVHAFPKVRTDTAEYLYVLTQSSDLGFEADEVEDLLLETEWANIDVDAAKEIAAQIVGSIKASLA